MGKIEKEHKILQHFVKYFILRLLLKIRSKIDHQWGRLANEKRLYISTVKNGCVRKQSWITVPILDICYNHPCNRWKCWWALDIDIRRLENRWIMHTAAFSHPRSLIGKAAWAPRTLNKQKWLGRQMTHSGFYPESWGTSLLWKKDKTGVFMYLSFNAVPPNFTAYRGVSAFFNMIPSSPARSSLQVPTIISSSVAPGGQKPFRSPPWFPNCDPWLRLKPELKPPSMINSNSIPPTSAGEGRQYRVYGSTKIPTRSPAAAASWKRWSPGSRRVIHSPSWLSTTKRTASAVAAHPPLIG